MKTFKTFAIISTCIFLFIGSAYSMTEPLSYFPVTVKVVIHWFKWGAEYSNTGIETERQRIKRLRITKQMELLNQAFAGANIQFVLASGPNVGDEQDGILWHLKNTNTYFSSLEEFERVSPPLDTREYLNLYVGPYNGITDQIGGYAIGETIFRLSYSIQSENGTSSNDKTEACAVSDAYFRSEDGTTLGSVTVHEVGHWFGLMHPLQIKACDDPAATYMNASNLAGTDPDKCGTHFDDAEVIKIRENIKKIRPWLHGYKIWPQIDFGETGLADKGKLTITGNDLNNVDYTLTSGLPFFWPRKNDGPAYIRTLTAFDQKISGKEQVQAFFKWEATAIQDVGNYNPYYNLAPTGSMKSISADNTLWILT